MSSASRRLRLAGSAFAFLGLAVLLLPAISLSLGRRDEEARVIVHGGRAFEKPYRAPYEPEKWRVVETGIADDLTALWAVDGRHAWAGGVSGGLYRTRDGGATWQPLVGVDLARFLQLVWKGPERGFALARDGEILRSDDGGATWVSSRKASSDRVLHMDFVDELHGWAVGERGLILQTADGGGTWSRQGETIAGDLTVVQMLSEKTGWAGGPGVLMGTADGGLAWRVLENAPGWRFVSGKRGYATDGAEILATDDGGESWRRVRTLERLLRSEAELPEAPEPKQPGRKRSPAPFIAGARFVDRYNGLAEIVDGDWQRLFRTRSLGRVWKRVYEARRGEGEELVSLAMSDGRNGLAIDGKGSLRATGDGARTWPVQIESTFYDFTDLHFTDPDRGWAVGARGRILVTEDGGRRWQEGARRVDVALRRVRSASMGEDGARAWVAGEGGTVLASVPEGRAWRSPWRSQRTTTREDLLDLDFLDAERGAAVGENGLLMTTADGGESWLRRETGIRGPVIAVALAGGDSLWLATPSALHRSSDGGRTLSAVDLPARSAAGAFAGLAAPDPAHLFALQTGGRLLRTADGGGAWRSIVLDPEARLRAVRFVNARQGWVLGRAGGSADVLYVTEDGGERWRKLDLPERDVRAVFFVDAQQGWLAGPQTIYRSLDGGLNWRRQPIEGSRFLRAFVLLEGGGAWAAGDNGLAARYPPPAGRSRPAGNEEGAGSPAPSPDP